MKQNTLSMLQQRLAITGYMLQPTTPTPPSVDEEQGSEQKATVACMMYMSLIAAKIDRAGEKSNCV
jgi:hypothetical protein